MFPITRKEGTVAYKILYERLTMFFNIEAPASQMKMQ